MTAMTVGGGPMDAGALRRAEERLGTRILRVFGMSECLGHTHVPPVRTMRSAGSPPTARPFPGTDLRAVDEQGVAGARWVGGTGAGARPVAVRRLRPRRRCAPA